VADAEQTAAVWPKLKDETRFYYGGMPTGLATLPETYEGWEFATGAADRYDLAAMGRVWYLESWARARMATAGDWSSPSARSAAWAKQSGYYCRERLHRQGAATARRNTASIPRI